ncbi:hypothetical protein HII31_11525 [Pseudocercospora fuligena]|uniref:Uncharacterized protein n=1 Tax=Pseudocercospora fuligena TaxID=685502 RepID=A0A8H6RA13_9PEZI|nr:hypothetical protein HII31_11525 [Pseudocercospora fuligena]
MCQTRNISYACGHTFNFRLSTCGGTYTYVSRKAREKRASCVGSALITMKSDAICGSCARTAREKKLNDELTALKRSLAKPDVDEWMMETPEEVLAAESKRDQELYLLDRRFPDGRVKKTARPEKGPGATRPGNRKSVLRQEVTPENVVVKLDINPYAVSASWDDWGDDYVRLEDEVAENQAAQEAAGITVSWMPWAGQEENEHEEYERSELQAARVDTVEERMKMDEEDADDETQNINESGEQLENYEVTESFPEPIGHMEPESSRETSNDSQPSNKQSIPSTPCPVVVRASSPAPFPDAVRAKENARPSQYPKNGRGPTENQLPSLSTTSNGPRSPERQALQESLPWHGYRSLGQQLLVSL